MPDFSTIKEAIEDIQNGKMVLVVDDMSEDTEGDLIMAAELVTPADITYMSRVSGGIIAVSGTAERIEELDLDLSGMRSRTLRGTQFGITIDARKGTTTGASSEDRAKTIRLFAHPESQADDFARPGHVTTLKALDGGILSRAGHTEASIDLARLAGMKPAGVLCMVMTPDGHVAKLSYLQNEQAMVVG